MVAPVGDDFVFNYSPAWNGEMILEGARTPLSDLQGAGIASPSSVALGALQLQIPRRARFVVRTGTATYLLSSVAPARKHPVPLFSIESSVVAYFAGTALAMLSFLGLLSLRQPLLSTMSFEWMSGDDRLVHIETTASESRLEETLKAGGTGGDRAGGASATMAAAEGTMGRESSPRKTGRHTIKKRHEGDPQLAREKEIEVARRAGLLGAFYARPGGAFESLVSTKDYASGLGRDDVLGGRLGQDIAEMAGGWGYGTEKTGPGDDGDGWKTIGTGRYNTIGEGPDSGTDYGTGGPGTYKGPGRPPQGPKVDVGCRFDDRSGCGRALGDLDRKIIRRYIRKKLPLVKHCYEKQLLVQPDLAGTVMTTFTISGNGAVLSAVAKGLGNRNVVACVEAALKSIQFPQPEGGGLVSVRYPFTFRPAHD